PVTHGSFDWFYRPPGDLFAQLRSPKSTGGIAADSGALVEVNHPRDSIMGYFAGFQMNAYNQYGGTTVQPTGSFHLDQTPGSPYEQKNFSLDFDVLEVFNGKHTEYVHNYRIPPNFTDPNLKASVFCTNGQTIDCVPAVGQ